MEKSLQLEKIVSGINSQHKERKNYVIYSSRALDHLAQVTPLLNTPHISYAREMVIAVYQGAKSRGGYRIQVKEVIERDNSLLVKILEIVPGQGASVDSFCAPYEIVKTAKVKGKKVLFHYEQTILPAKKTRRCNPKR